jgi:hypothetical protein
MFLVRGYVIVTGWVATDMAISVATQPVKTDQNVNFPFL